MEKGKKQGSERLNGKGLTMNEKLLGVPVRRLTDLAILDASGHNFFIQVSDPSFSNVSRLSKSDFLQSLRWATAEYSKQQKFEAFAKLGCPGWLGERLPQEAHRQWLG